MKLKLASLFPDLLILAGLGLLGYGLYLYMPWVSYSVVGALLLSLGLLSALRG